ncbi:MAG: T9SS type A sorting domain-containing protein, partial [FCB group bacterium]|nr:T9SS type A sorting domain-containing protein [FCB group bacterium]
YAAAVTTLSGTTTYDIWVRKYTGSSSQWGDWSKEVSDLSDTWLPAWDDGLATGDYYPCFVAGRPYTSGANTYHRVYLSTDQYGMVMFDTGDLTNTPITVNEGSNSSFSHNWHPRWLEINPLESDEDIDDLILSTFKSAIEEGKMDYTNDPFITWDTEFYGWSTTEGGTDLSGGIVREPYVDVNEQKIFLPCEFSGIFSIPLDGYTGGEPYSRNLGTTNTNWYEDANFGNNLETIIASPFESDKYYVGCKPYEYWELGKEYPNEDWQFPNLYIYDKSSESFEMEEFDENVSYEDDIWRFAASFEDSLLYFSMRALPPFIEGAGYVAQYVAPTRIWKMRSSTSFTNIFYLDDNGGNFGLINFSYAGDVNAGVTAIAVNPQNGEDLIFGLGTYFGTIQNYPNSNYNNGFGGYLGFLEYENQTYQLSWIYQNPTADSDTLFRSPFDIYVTKTDSAGDEDIAMLVATADFSSNEFPAGRLHDRGSLFLIYGDNGDWIAEDVTPDGLGAYFNTDHPAIYQVDAYCLDEYNIAFYCIVYGRDANASSETIDRAMLYTTGWLPRLNWWEMINSDDWRIVEDDLTLNSEQMAIDSGNGEIYLFFGNASYTFTPTVGPQPVLDVVSGGAGWNWVSINHGLWDSNIKKVTSTIEELDRVRDINYNSYIVSTGVDSTWDWNPMEYYEVKVSDSCNFETIGPSIPYDTTYSVKDSAELRYNWISYMPDDTMSVKYAFYNVKDTVLIVKNDDGDWFTPQNSAGTNFDMIPGEGYKIMSEFDLNFEYPDPTQEPESMGKPEGITLIQNMATSHFDYLSKTGDYQAIQIDSLTINGELPNISDEIGIFTPAGLCVGGAVYEGEFPICLAAWKDDWSTEVIDGYTPGEYIGYKFWDNQAGIEIDIDLPGVGSQFIQSCNADKFFEGDYICNTSFSGTYSLPREYSLAQNYPNPFNPETFIKYNLKWNSDVTISVFNLLGQEVIRLVDGLQNAGYHDIKWNSKSSNGIPVSSGIYFLKLQAKATEEHYGNKESFNKSIKMMILK